MTFRIKNVFLPAVFLVFICNLTFAQKNKKFTVILDAGHGGKDFGANYHGHVEKKITLAVVLKVGRILEKFNDIEVIFTRRSDEFIQLKERADIANRNNANLFISIHCNADRNTKVNGTETFVIGMSRSDLNLEVAKSENSVIFLEDNYKQAYRGFDPNTPETLIGLKLIQENNLTNSISLATKIQQNFKNYEFKSRGVKQEPLWVLDATIMPGVLIETGFISNRIEGERLSSESGQMDSATSIANAIIEYKKEYFGESGVAVKTQNSKKNSEPEPVKNTQTNDDSEGLTFKVQISSGSQKIDLDPKNFNGLSDISYEYNKGIYKYMYGSTSDYKVAKKLIKEAKDQGYISAFLVAFKNGQKINAQEAIK